MMQKLLLVLCLMIPAAVFAQGGTIKGQILDSETGEGLVGASVVVKGTTKGAVTDIEGNFSIGSVEDGEVVLLVNYIGYVEQQIMASVSGGSVSIDPVKLETSSIGLTEVVISGTAVDRKTPVAVSTVKTLDIESKIGSQEFPEILKSTPGVYATKTGGGFGDGRVNVRGFDDSNVAVLINGVPVNDMENGRVYWSNWAGLSDAASSVQVQRGLGASKIAVPSVGGTINIVSKASEREQGGNIYYGAGNDGYNKVGFGVSTGLMDNDWAVTLSGSRTAGDGYVKGTEFLGFSYFANIAKKINNDHEVTFTAVGAKQRHGQRQNQVSLADFENAPHGIQYNPDWGVRDGKVVHVEDNFYHKPQMSLNHYWTVSPNTQVSTSAYASFGTGGGGGTAGDFVKNRTNGQYGPIDLDFLVDRNQAAQDGNALAWMRASRNDHNWYGVLSTVEQDLGNGLNLMAGFDGRYYKGKHFRTVTDLLGADYAIDDNDINEPVKVVRTGDKFSYHNVGLVRWYGAFAQLEYTLDDLSTFITVNGASVGNKRIDYFNYLDSDPEQETDWINFTSFGVKGGANYNLTDNHNVFANVGYFERAPFFDAVFLNFRNDINEDAENEKVISTEIGYGYRSSILNANVNVYRTEWLDRSFTASSTTPDGELIFGNLLGVDALHQGIEIDATATPIPGLQINGMLSIADWTWQNNLENVTLTDEEQNPITTVNMFIKDVHVGDAAQTTAALGFRYELFPGMRFGLDYNYYDRIYANYDPTNRDTQDTDGNNFESWKMPSYGLVDFILIYDFDLAGFKSSLYGNVYNIGNTEYVADAQDGSNHDAATSRVFYGFGTTWNMGLKLRF